MYDIKQLNNIQGQARKVASTDTLGSDAALEIESNDSLYGMLRLPLKWFIFQ